MLQYFPGLKDMQSFGSARPFWTLAIEWWFYLAFGWLVLMKATTPAKIVLKIFILIPLLIVPVFNIYGRGNGLSLIWIAGSVASGFLVPYLTKHIRFKNSYAVFAALVATFMTISFALWMSAAFFFWICYLQMKDLKVPRWLKNISFHIASFSFTLYLIHYTVIDFLIHVFRETLSPEMILLVSLVTSNLLSYLISLGTENRHKEFSAWLKKFTGISPVKVTA
jgi:peptidoglycan/LPS O-acetylase OafA/YrhL